MGAVASAAKMANTAFYRALNERDVSAMGRLLADEAYVCACTHPGKPRAQGREAVLCSWAAILGARSVPKITVANERVLLATESGAVVVCSEVFGSGGFLEATNSYVRGAD